MSCFLLIRWHCTSFQQLRSICGSGLILQHSNYSSQIIIGPSKMSHRNILLGLFRSIDNSTYLQLSCIFHAITNLVIFSIHLSMKLINPSKLHSSPFVWNNADIPVCDKADKQHTDCRYDNCFNNKKRCRIGWYESWRNCQNDILTKPNICPR